ncbi:MAG TPA: hypothetical protein VK585_17995 [Jiangellaceae bacterium]|nr:hypothetical protein [Jiangellaceae bacterium]
MAHLIGLYGYQAATLFILIDIPALVGKALRLRYFSTTTRKTGLRLMIVSGTLSLVCNVLSGWFGGGVGPAGYGAFVVLMFLVMENVVTRIKPAAAVTRAKNATSDTTDSTPAQPALTPAQRGAETRKRNAEVKRLEAAYAAQAAPVSGA